MTRSTRRANPHSQKATHAKSAQSLTPRLSFVLYDLKFYIKKIKRLTTKFDFKLIKREKMWICIGNRDEPLNKRGPRAPRKVRGKIEFEFRTKNLNKLLYQLIFRLSSTTNCSRIIKPTIVTYRSLSDRTNLPRYINSIYRLNFDLFVRNRYFGTPE